MRPFVLPILLLAPLIVARPPVACSAALDEAGVCGGALSDIARVRKERAERQALERRGIQNMPVTTEALSKVDRKLEDTSRATVRRERSRKNPDLPEKLESELARFEGAKKGRGRKKTEQLAAIEAPPAVARADTGLRAAYDQKPVPSFRNGEVVLTDGLYRGPNPNAKIGMYGDVFDPPRAEQLEALQRAIQKLDLEEVYVVVRRGHDEGEEAMLDMATRLKLAGFSVAHDPRIRFVDARAFPNRTYPEILELVAAKNPSRPVHVLGGEVFFHEPFFGELKSPNVRYTFMMPEKTFGEVEGIVRARFGNRVKKDPNLVTYVDAPVIPSVFKAQIALKKGEFSESLDWRARELLREKLGGAGKPAEAAAHAEPAPAPVAAVAPSRGPASAGPGLAHAPAEVSKVGPKLRVVGRDLNPNAAVDAAGIEVKTETDVRRLAEELATLRATKEERGELSGALRARHEALEYLNATRKEPLIARDPEGAYFFQGAERYAQLDKAEKLTWLRDVASSRHPWADTIFPRLLARETDYDVQYLLREIAAKRGLERDFNHIHQHILQDMLTGQAEHLLTGPLRSELRDMPSAMLERILQKPELRAIGVEGLLGRDARFLGNYVLDADEKLALGAVRGLRLNTSQEAKRILMLAADSPHRPVQMEASRLLLNFHDPEVRKFFWARMNNAAVFHVVNEKYLIHAETDGEVFFTPHAVHGLISRESRMPDGAFVKRLLSQPLEEVQRLKEDLSLRPPDALYALLKHKDPRVREIVAHELLGRSVTNRSAIRDLLLDSTRDVKMAGLALVNQPEFGAADRIKVLKIVAAEEPDPEVAAAARRSLAEYSPILNKRFYEDRSNAAQRMMARLREQAGTPVHEEDLIPMKFAGDVYDYPEFLNSGRTGYVVANPQAFVDELRAMREATTPGYKLEFAHADADTGWKAVMYRAEATEGKGTERPTVFAISGTANWPDWVTNFNLGRPQAESPFYREMLERAVEEVKTRQNKVVVTGHSLGGAMSQMFGHDLVKALRDAGVPNPESRVRVVVFNGYGAREALERMGRLDPGIAERLDVRNYRLRGDPVSRIGTPLGNPDKYVELRRLLYFRPATTHSMNSVRNAIAKLGGSDTNKKASKFRVPGVAWVSDKLGPWVLGKYQASAEKIRPKLVENLLEARLLAIKAGEYGSISPETRYFESELRHAVNALTPAQREKIQPKLDAFAAEEKRLFGELQKAYSIPDSNSQGKVWETEAKGEAWLAKRLRRELESRLRSGVPVKTEDLPSKTPGQKLLTFVDGTKGVWTPIEAPGVEQLLADYRIDRALAGRSVPAVEFRELEGKGGVVQAFLPTGAPRTPRSELRDFLLGRLLVEGRDPGGEAASVALAAARVKEPRQLERLATTKPDEWRELLRDHVGGDDIDRFLARREELLVRSGGLLDLPRVTDEATVPSPVKYPLRVSAKDHFAGRNADVNAAAMEAGIIRARGRMSTLDSATRMQQALRFEDPRVVAAAVNGAIRGDVRESLAADFAVQAVRKLPMLDPSTVAAAVEGALASGRYDDKAIIKAFELTQNFYRGEGNPYLLNAIVRGGVYNLSPVSEVKKRVEAIETALYNVDKRIVAAAIEGALQANVTDMRMLESHVSAIQRDLYVYDRNVIAAAVHGSLVGHRTPEQAVDLARTVSTRLYGLGLVEQEALITGGLVRSLPADQVARAASDPKFAGEQSLVAGVVRGIPVYSESSRVVLEKDRPALAAALRYQETAADELAAVRRAYFRGEARFADLEREQERLGIAEAPLRGRDEASRRLGYLAQELDYLKRARMQAAVDDVTEGVEELDTQYAAVAAKLLGETERRSAWLRQKENAKLVRLQSLEELEQVFVRYRDRLPGESFGKTMKHPEGLELLRGLSERDALEARNAVASAREVLEREVGRILSDRVPAKELAERKAKFVDDLTALHAENENRPGRAREFLAKRGWQSDELDACFDRLALCVPSFPEMETTKDTRLSATARRMLLEKELLTHPDEEVSRLPFASLAVRRDAGTLEKDLKDAQRRLKRESDALAEKALVYPPYMDEAKMAREAELFAMERIANLKKSAPTVEAMRKPATWEAKLADDVHLELETALRRLTSEDLANIHPSLAGFSTRALEDSESRARAFAGLKSVVSQMSPEERSKVTRSFLNWIAGVGQPLYDAIPREPGTGVDALAAAIRRADAIQSVAGRTDGALSGAVLREHHVNTGSRLVAEALGAVPDAKKSDRELAQSALLEAKETKREVQSALAAASGERFQGKAESQLPGVFLQKTLEDIKGMPGLDKETQDKLFATLREFSKTEPDRAIRLRDHLKALSSNPDMFDNFRLSMESAIDDFRKTGRKSWDESWERGVENMLSESGLSKAAIAARANPC